MSRANFLIRERHVVNWFSARGCFKRPRVARSRWRTVEQWPTRFEALANLERLARDRENGQEYAVFFRGERQ